MKNRLYITLALLLGISSLFGAATASINDLPARPTSDEINVINARLKEGKINAPADEVITKTWAVIRTQLINSVIQKKRSLSDALYRQNEGIVPYALEKRNAIGVAIALTIALNDQLIAALLQAEGKSSQNVFETYASLIPAYADILFSLKPFETNELLRRSQNLQIYFSQPLSEAIRFGIIRSLNSFAKATKWYTAFGLVKPLVDYGIIKPDNESLINFILDSLSAADQQKFTALLEEKKASQPKPAPQPAPIPQATEFKDIRDIFDIDKAEDRKQALSKHKELVNVLFEENGRSYSPLIYAIDTPNAIFYTTYAEILIKNGANLNWQDKEGNTALIYAAMGGEDKARAVELLINHGADKTIRNKHGVSALLAAIQAGHPTQILNSLSNEEAQKLLDSNLQRPRSSDLVAEKIMLENKLGIVLPKGNLDEKEEEEKEERKPIFNEDHFFEQNPNEPYDDIIRQLNPQDEGPEQQNPNEILNATSHWIRTDLWNYIRSGNKLSASEAQQLIELANMRGTTSEEQAKQRAAHQIIMSKPDAISNVNDQAVVDAWNRIARHK